VFCDRHFAQGDHIIIMTGTLLPRHQQPGSSSSSSSSSNNSSSSDERYSYDVSGVRGIDALLMKDDAECNIGKYVNSAAMTNLLANCVVLEHEHGLLFVSALRAMEPMEELLLDYAI
jgi:hypothetical protein